MKSYIVHLQNKYPGARVMASDSSVVAYDQEGNALAAVAKDGNGVWGDAKRDIGARDSFSLDPMPKNARFRKLFDDGSIGDSEEAKVRKPIAQSLASDFGCVPGLAEIKAAKGKASRGEQLSEREQKLAALELTGTVEHALEIVVKAS